GGYCLEWPDQYAPKLHSGEIIGVKEVYAPYWKIGEIVWQKKTEEGLIKTGVRLLSSEAIPLVARIPQNMGNRGDNLSCFLLPKDVSLGLKQPTFLAPNVRLQMGEKIRIAQEGNEQSIQLMAPVKETTYYSQFECAYIVLTAPQA
ncbi:MAG: hypothetical protein KDI30_12645, partial [Pseudomonadales bacterium]|nr:hypothetical protein [Pseudomonadales bacterium]